MNIWSVIINRSSFLVERIDQYSNNFFAKNKTHPINAWIKFIDQSLHKQMKKLCKCYGGCLSCRQQYSCRWQLLTCHTGFKLCLVLASHVLYVCSVSSGEEGKRKKKAQILTLERLELWSVWVFLVWKN